jgi:uncharacterized protein with HEPN domain
MRDPERDNLDYLNDILERLQRIRNFAQEGKTAFLESVMMQDAIIRNFEVMGEATKRLTTDLANSIHKSPGEKSQDFEMF